MTASMNTWRRGWSSWSMTVRRLAKSRRLDVTTIELVALSALTFTRDSKISSGALPAGGRACPARRRPAGRAPVMISFSVLRELHGVRVLEHHDVDLALARRCWGRRGA